jgi:prepilin-type N-terminal cleavage/methylation domain-containing protein
MKRSGYTLFELMLVMAIMLIVAALATPIIFESMYGGTKVTTAADVVRARWNDCQAHAVDEGQPYRFAVIPNTGKFKIEPWPQAYADQAAAVQGGSGQGGGSGMPSDPGAGSSDRPKGITIEDKLPQGVRFGTKDAPVDPHGDEASGGDYVTVAVFMPDGVALDDVEITFGGAGVATVTIRLEAASGNSYVVQPNNQKEEGR